jgi:hypothetical protein
MSDYLRYYGGATKLQQAGGAEAHVGKPTLMCGGPHRPARASDGSTTASARAGQAAASPDVL